MKIDASIFRAYDVRGTYPEPLSEDLAYAFGRGAAEMLRFREAAVGRDMRVSADPLAGALSRGLREGGTAVVDVGRVTTPMLYFAIGHLALPGGIMVTASHNPAAYNGFKVSRENAIPVADQELQELRRLIERGFAPAKSAPADERKADLTEVYVLHVHRFLRSPLRPLRIVVDAGNGMAGTILPHVYKDLPLKVTPMYFEPDGNFPHHEADPLKPQNMADLQERVLRERADLGVAFDGDADRVIFVDEQAQIVSADLVTALLGRRFLAREPGATIVYDVRSSRVVRETVSACGGQPVVCRVGHAFMKRELRKHGAVFGGELAGHYYFRDNYSADSSDAAALMVYEALSESGGSMSELMRPYRRYVASGEINSQVRDPKAKMEEIRKDHGDGRVSTLDGVTVEYDTWWFNLRESNTEPLLRLNVEASSMKEMEEQRDRLLKLIRS